MPSPAIRAATRADLPVVQRLAERTWRAHYPGIITHAQIDYMLERGYADAALEGFLGASGCGLVLALHDADPIGFAAWLREGEGTSKLDKLYVLPAAQGAGAGRALIEHVAAAAARDGAVRLILNVNKHNTQALTVYARCGFTIREATVIDIGGGFVMDDYVMERTLR